MLSKIKDSLSKFLIRNSVPVLCYHSINEYPMPLPAFTFMQKKIFEGQMGYIADKFNPISLDVMFEKIKKNENTKDCVCITFDDGYLNNYFTVLPILKKYSIPVTIFLNTAFINTQMIKWSDVLYSAFALTKKNKLSYGDEYFEFNSIEERYATNKIINEKIKRTDFQKIDVLINDLMLQLGITHEIIINAPFFHELKMLGWDELSEMQKSGLVNFGAHTHTHPILTRLPNQVAQREIIDSIDVLNKKLKCTNYFAYPNGSRLDYSDAHIEMLQNANITVAFSTNDDYWDSGKNMFEVPRFVIGNESNVASIDRILSGKAIFDSGYKMRKMLTLLYSGKK